MLKNNVTSYPSQIDCTGDDLYVHEIVHNPALYMTCDMEKRLHYCHQTCRQIKPFQAVGTNKSIKYNIIYETIYHVFYWYQRTYLIRNHVEYVYGIYKLYTVTGNVWRITSQNKKLDFPFCQCTRTFTGCIVFSMSINRMVYKELLLTAASSLFTVFKIPRWSKITVIITNKNEI